MTEQLVHFKRNEAVAICDARLAPDIDHPAEVNEETVQKVSCPKCLDIAVAPPNIDHRAGNFML
jgi:hypothetical protein